MSGKPVPERISTDSRRYGNHLSRKRGDDIHYYCDNCGKYAFKESKGLTIYPSVRIFCSKECEDNYLPRWVNVTLIYRDFLGLGLLVFLQILKIFEKGSPQLNG